MNNEEKNLTPENVSVEENNTAKTESGSGNKPSGGVLAAIIGGVVLVIVAIILLIVLLPGSGNNSGDGNGDDTGSGNVGDDNSGNKNENTKVTYTVTVIDQNGDSVPGVVVYFYPQGGIDVPMGTKDDGTVTYTTDKEMKFSIFSLPDNYEYDDMSMKQSFGKEGKITVTVVKKEVENTGVSYLIKVVDQYDNPVVGAGVQMCIPGSGCIPFDKTTDENGESVKVIDADNYKAQISGLPDGYTDSTNGEYQDFSGDAENGFTVTIKVTKN